MGVPVVEVRRTHAHGPTNSRLVDTCVSEKRTSA